MSVIFAKKDDERCESVSDKEPHVRCKRVKGHGGYHQDDRYAWPPQTEPANPQEVLKL